MKVHSSFRFSGVIIVLALLVYACAPSKSAGDTAPDQATTSTPDVDQAAETDAEVDPEPAPAVSTVAWDQGASLTVNCGGAPLDLTNPVGIIAENISQDSLMYDVEPFSDCSGIFHRFLDSLEKRCPDHSYPDPAQFRSSRGVGKWYHEQGKFVRVNDPLNMGHLIKPGAVMFYAGSQFKIDSTETADFFKSGGIRHVGVITAVKTDDEGMVTGYTLFHGRTSGKLAGNTNYHKRVYKNRPNYPAYGNGGDHWIGVAPVLVDALAVAGEGAGEGDGEGSN
ncbi:MAG: hypothetical protein AAFV07_20300 [Bacteroidota bacterium]